MDVKVPKLYKRGNNVVVKKVRIIKNICYIYNETIRLYKII